MVARPLFCFAMQSLGASHGLISVTDNSPGAAENSGPAAIAGRRRPRHRAPSGKAAGAAARQIGEIQYPAGAMIPALAGRHAPIRCVKSQPDVMK
jgi:hypothetical protein